MNRPDGEREGLADKQLRLVNQSSQNYIYCMGNLVMVLGNHSKLKWNWNWENFPETTSSLQLIHLVFLYFWARQLWIQFQLVRKGKMNHSLGIE